MNQELTFRFSVTEVIKRVNENRTAHEVDYNDAVEGFWIEAEKQLSKVVANAKLALKAAQAKTGSPKDLLRNANFFLSLTQPEHHLKEYDQILDMLEFTVEDSIELTESQYRKYILDEWDWKQRFVTSNELYHTHTAR